MPEIEKQIRALRDRLTRLQNIKRRRATKPKSETTQPRGRPRVDPAKIEQARQLARDYPIPDVALVTEISLSTLYSRGIKRYRLNAEPKSLAIAA